VNDYGTGISTADASFAVHQSVAHAFDDSEWADLEEPEDFVCPSFKIRAADSSGERSSASVLIQRMYATRGYKSSPLPEKRPPHLVTLVASDHSDTIGTMTVGFDSADGLLADDLFGAEIDELRRAGRQVCEFTKLAIDASSQSKPVLAALFHVAYIYAHRIRGVDDLLIEVNPRHARYYASMLGFKVIGSKRLNRRVNAPAVLLSVTFDHVRTNIASFGGKPEEAAAERSLYPFSFSAHEEAGIVGRLRSRFCDAPQRAPLTAMRRPSIEAGRLIPASCLSEARCA
jgi:hypothetical protein